MPGPVYTIAVTSLSLPPTAFLPFESNLSAPAERHRVSMRLIKAVVNYEKMDCVCLLVCVSKFNLHWFLFFYFLTLFDTHGSLIPLMR